MAKIKEIYKFGADGNETAGKVVLKDLLLLSIGKRLKFNATLKGKATFQNFACFTTTGQALQKSNQDEARVRNALTLMYNEMTADMKNILG